MIQKLFSFELITKLRFGQGSLKYIHEDLNPYGKNILIVAQKKMEEIGYLQRVTDLFHDRDCNLYYWKNIHENPIISDVDDAVHSIPSKKIDVIIALGGGSTIDVAKGISVVACTGGSAWDYVYSTAKRNVEQTIPVIAVPTTSGTGSHMTKYSVLTNPDEGIKSTIVSEKIFPRVAIVDPTFMLSLPQKLTAITGFDALSHAIESYVCINANRITDMICEDAIKTITRVLPRVMNDPQNIFLREDLAWADTLAGLGIAYSGTTLPHAMGQPISGKYGQIRHGETLAALYPPFIQFSYPGNVEKFNHITRWIAEGIDLPIDKIDGEVATEVFVDFLKGIGMNIHLSDFGLKEGDIDYFLDPAMKCGDVFTNPVVASEEDITELYRRSL